MKKNTTGPGKNSTDRSARHKAVKFKINEIHLHDENKFYQLLGFIKHLNGRETIQTPVEQITCDLKELIGKPGYEIALRFIDEEYKAVEDGKIMNEDMTNILDRFQSRKLIFELNKMLLELETADVMDLAGAVGVLSDFFRTVKKRTVPPVMTGNIVNLKAWMAYH